MNDSQLVLKDLAPIVLFVYNRPEHTRKTIESLLKNILAERSKLIIYSDGAKNDDDSKKVLSVRKFIHNINGFENVQIFEREKNLGLAKSIITGISEVINKYGKVIVLEDDIITSKNFLNFMNSALNFYMKNVNIFSISGYTYPILIPTEYNHDVFISYRASSWGWATWKDRWEKADWQVDDFKEFEADRLRKKKFNTGGQDLTPMLYNQMKGNIDSWAIRWVYAHFKFNSYCLFPVKTFCKNIGTDSSGIHSSSTTKFEVLLEDNDLQINFTNNLELNEDIINAIKKFFQPSVYRRIINFFKEKLY